MTSPWTPTGDKWPQMAMVWVKEPDSGWPTIIVGDGWAAYRVPSGALHPMPSTITPEQQTVLDAAELQEKAACTPGVSVEIYCRTCVCTNKAVRAMRAAQQPPDRVAEVKAAFDEMLRRMRSDPGLTERLRAAIAALEAKS